MRRILVTSVLVVGLGQPITAQQSPPAWTPELQLQVKRVSDVRVSPDGQRVVFEVATAVMEEDRSAWVPQIWIANADGTGQRQLTYGPDPSRAPAWSPDGRWIAFLSTRNGKTNVYRLPLGGGESERLTNVKSSVADFAWSPDGSRMAVLIADSTTTAEDEDRRARRDARVIDEGLKPIRLYVLDLSRDDEIPDPRLLTPGNVHVTDFDWAPDGLEIVFTHQPTPSVNDWPAADVSIVEVATGTRRTLVNTRRAESGPRFSPDGQSIAYTASDDPPTWGFTSRVHVIPRSGGTPKPLAESYDQQPTIVGWSADGSRVLITEVHRTVSRLSALPVDGSAPVDISPADMMVGSVHLNSGRTHVGFVSQDVDRAPEAWMAALGDRFQPRQVSRVQPRPAAPLGKTEVVRWTSGDGKEIEGLLTTPPNYRPGTPVPLLVVVHGGPTGVFTRSYIASASPYPLATFASKGYAILRCNVRGSSGYGREFRYANYKDWGGGDFRDIMTGIDALIARGVADSTRLGIMGWSYGGYMTSWVITQTQRFKAASVGAGVTNLMSFTGTADIPAFLPDYFGGEFWDVFDVWRSHSAMFNIKGVTTPTLIQHGEQDARVPVSQGYELYNALKRQGVTTRMVVYPRMGHGLTEPTHQLHAAQDNVSWFDRHLAAKPAATSSNRQ
ncbi:MAG TPA: S9 family peptidase [Gemmatimonadaceae bacterium]